MIEFAPPNRAVARLGIRVELTLQAEAQLRTIQRALADLADHDMRRENLVEREAELGLLLDDLACGLPSPGVLAAAVRLRS